MSDDMATLADPKTWPGVQQELRKSQIMAVALQQIVAIAGRETAVGKLAWNALQGKSQ